MPQLFSSFNPPAKYGLVGLEDVERRQRATELKALIATVAASLNSVEEAIRDGGAVEDIASKLKAIRASIHAALPKVFTAGDVLTCDSLLGASCHVGQLLERAGLKPSAIL